MGKIIHSLQTKLIASFILLILIIAGGTFLFTYDATKQALLQSTRDDMQQITGMASQTFTPREVDFMYNLQPGQENSTEYLAMKKKMQDLRSLSPNIVNFYTMRIDGTKVTFLIDDLEDDPATIGQQYEKPESKLFDAANGIRISDNVYTDEWGSFLSGYAPLYDSTSRAAVILGADMTASKVLERENFIGNTIYLIMGIGVLFALAIIGFFSVTIIRDIRKLNRTAEEISRGNTNVIVDVKRSDEIGELADSFSRMVASLKIMMMDQQDENKF